MCSLSPPFEGCLLHGGLCLAFVCVYVVNDRIEEAEISDEERARMNDTVFQQMEHEVGIVMQQVPQDSYWGILIIA